MAEQMTTKRHYYSLDIYKFLCAFCVVFSHMAVPGAVSDFLCSAGRIAVPSFFVISGYFSYNTSPQRLTHRIRHIFRLNLWGVFLTLGWSVICVELNGITTQQFQGSSLQYLKAAVPSGTQWITWLLLDEDPFCGLLWYLMATMKCYAILWCYVTLSGSKTPDLRPFYLAGLLLLVMNLSLGVLSAASGGAINHLLRRGTLFTGIPFFAMGLFFAQYGQLIWERFRFDWKKLTILILSGLALSWLEQQYVSVNAFYIGSIPIIIALFSLAIRYPGNLSQPWLAALLKKCGAWSVGIYLAQFVASSISINFVVPALWHNPNWPWFHAVFVMALSFCLAVANDALYTLIRRIRKKPSQV